MNKRTGEKRELNWVPCFREILIQEVCIAPTLLERGDLEGGGLCKTLILVPKCSHLL